MARRRSDGRVELLGRMEDVIRHGDRLISPLHVEQAFLAHDDVHAALAGPGKSSAGRPVLRALVVPRQGVRLDAAALMEWAAKRLDHRDVPETVHVMPALPMGRGKARRSAVAELVEQVDQGA